MKSLFAAFVGVMSLVLSAAPLHDVLVSREGVSVEKWQAPEAGNGKWRRVGVWLDGKASGVAPHGLAAADDIVYVGDANEGGRILRYSPDGRQLGVFCKLDFVPDQLCLSPDGKSLYVTRLAGSVANGIYRFAVADGKGGQIVSRAGLRTMEFGPDGLLYVGDRDTRAVRSYDVSGAKVREVGCFALPGSQGGFWLTGPLRTRLVSPAAEVETVDLVTGRSRRCQEGHVRNGFATARVGRNWVVGDFVKGEIFVRIAADGLMSVAGGVKNVCALVDLTDALNGTVRRVQKETAQALGTRHPGVKLVAGAEDGCFYRLQNERAQAREDPVDAYEVTVNGRPVTLHGADVEFLDWGEEYYFGSFDLAGPTEVRIRSKRPLDQTVILPAEKYGIKAKVSADEIVFTADRPFRISIEPDHRVKPLLLFANAPEKDAPKKGDPNVIWYGPGVHEAGLIRVGSNQTLYLADGAVVRGTVRAEGENITICGRGILDGGMYARWRGPVGWCINLTNCRKITLKDFIFRNPHSWSLSMIHCSDVLIENFKLCGSRQINDDAIDINNSQRVTIRDCFLRAQDDIFAIKGLESYGAVKTACEDIDISGCECWTDCANIFRIGYECNATAMRRIRARDLDVLHYARNFRPVEHFWANCIFFLQAAGGMPIEDVVVEDMRIHSSEYPCVMMSARPMKTRVHGKDYKSGGPIRNCTFRNVSVRGAADFRGPVLIRGENENESVKGIVLENFTYNGKKLTASTPGVTVGPFAQAEIR